MMFRQVDYRHGPTRDAPAHLPHRLLRPSESTDSTPGHTAIAVILLIPQTIWVNADNPDDINASYWIIQIISLAVGLGLTLLGRRQARTRRSASVG